MSLRLVALGLSLLKLSLLRLVVGGSVVVVVGSQDVIWLDVVVVVVLCWILEIGGVVSEISKVDGVWEGNHWSGKCARSVSELRPDEEDEWVDEVQGGA